MKSIAILRVLSLVIAGALVGCCPVKIHLTNVPPPTSPPSTPVMGPDYGQAHSVASSGTIRFLSDKQFNLEFFSDAAGSTPIDACGTADKHIYTSGASSPNRKGKSWSTYSCKLDKKTINGQPLYYGFLPIAQGTGPQHGDAPGIVPCGGCFLDPDN